LFGLLIAAFGAVHHQRTDPHLTDHDGLFTGQTKLEKSTYVTLLCGRL